MTEICFNEEVCKCIFDVMAVSGLFLWMLIIMYAMEKIHDWLVRIL